jgi:hypothetical protein
MPTQADGSLKANISHNNNLNAEGLLGNTSIQHS